MIATLPLEGHGWPEIDVVEKSGAFNVAEEFNGRRQAMTLLITCPLPFIPQFSVRAIDPGPSASPSDGSVMPPGGLSLGLRPDKLVPKEEAVISPIEVQSADHHVLSTTLKASLLTGLYSVLLLAFLGEDLGQRPVGAQIQRHSEPLDEGRR